MAQEPQGSESTQIARLMTGGLAAFSLAGFFHLARQPTSLDAPQLAALFCFAVAIPVLTAGFMAASRPYMAGALGWATYILEVCALFIAVAGLALLFVHVNVAAAFVFLVFAAVSAHLAALRLLRRDGKPEPPRNHRPPAAPPSPPL